jgi:replicative superfamily II helicase
MMKRDRTAYLAIVALGLWLAWGALPVAAAGMYKWTDDKGVVHYSDQMPPDEVNKGTVLLDKQGRQVKKIEPAPSATELKAKAAEDEREKANARLKAEKARKDLALLQSYSSEEEIEIARNRAVSAIDGQVKSAQGYSADLARRQQELEKQKSATAGKPVPAALENELSTITGELGRQAQLIAQKKGELVTINARYDADKQRWRDIRDEQIKAAAEARATPAPRAPTAAAK